MSRRRLSVASLSGAAGLWVLLVAPAALLAAPQPPLEIQSPIDEVAGEEGKGKPPDTPKDTSKGAESAAAAAEGATAGAKGAGGIELVTLPSPGSPIVAIRAFFRTGSVDDPAGKEGLADLTASIVGEGATKKHSYKDIVEALYPLAASINTQVDREVTVFSLVVHRDKLAEATALFTEVLTQPAFDAADFERHRKDLESYLTTVLRASNDELLGLEELQQRIFAGHPYGHSPAGTVQGLHKITLDDVRTFYRQHLTTGNLMLGVAGGYPEGYPQQLATALAGLPAGGSTVKPLPPAPMPQARVFEILSKQAASTGIQLGYPLPITRADDDWWALMVANSYLGEHRTFNGKLQQELRAKRGLNYGNYSYLEYYHLPPQTTNPTPNAPRRQQYFSVWVRPVQAENAPFALRAALYQVQQLADHGMSQKDFELTRDYLTSYSKLWAQTLSRRLGFLLDSKFYGTPYYIDEIGARLAKLTVADVNRAAKKYLQTDRFTAVLVAGNGDALAEQLRTSAAAPPVYQSPVQPEVQEVDKAFVAMPISAAKVTVVPVAEVFEK